LLLLRYIQLPSVLLGPNLTRTLVANSEISTLQVRQVPENSVCQDASLRENEFATSVNKPVTRGNKEVIGSKTQELKEFSDHTFHPSGLQRR
jgi:hypothetical protein